MEGFGIDFEWTVFADYNVEETPPIESPTPLVGGASIPKLVASGEPLTTRPLVNFPELYLHLAKSEPTVEGHKIFAKKYGLLTDREWEFTFYWTRSVENMRKLVMKVENTVNWDIRDGKYIPFELHAASIFVFGRTVRPAE